MVNYTFEGTGQLNSVSQIPPGTNGQVLSTVAGATAWAAAAAFTAQSNVTIGGMTDTLEHFIMELA